MDEKVKIIIDVKGQVDCNDTAALVITPNKQFLADSGEEIGFLNLAALFDICFENVVKILNSCCALDDAEVFERIKEIEKSFRVLIK